MIEFTLWDILRNLLLATRWTILLSLVSFIGGGVVGLGLLFLRISKRKAFRTVAKYYIELFQGTPLLMQLFIAFFGLGLFGIDVPAWLAAGFALILWSAAFLAEIWRGCVEAVVKGQWEASASLGMGRLQQMRHVVLPQSLRIAMPPTVGFMVQIVKGTALASIIGFHELSHAGTVRQQCHFEAVPRLWRGRRMYFAVCWPLSLSQPDAGEEIPCRSSKSLRCPSASATTDVLNGIDLDVEREVVAIIGRSGSGKSTLLRCINGLETIDGGRVAAAGVESFEPSVHLKACASASA